MTPIPSKDDFAYYAETYFRVKNKAVEVGAYRGEFAKNSLKTWRGEYFLVDTWAHRKDDELMGLHDKNHFLEEEWEEIYQAAKSSGGILLKGYSVDMAKTFEDGSLDWVFIDAGHDYVNFTKDVFAWWPKLREGGLFSGDDYGLCSDSQVLYPLTVRRWETQFSGVARTYKWGTALGINQFCENNRLDLHITYLDKVPSWYLIK